MCGRRLCGPCGGTGSACVCVFQACGRSGGRVGRSRSCGRCHPVMWSMHAHVVEVPRSGGPCPSLCGPGMIAQVVHVPRSCGPGMHFRSLRWSMSLAHVAHARNVRRLCGPPSVMWPMHETSVAHVGPRRSCGPGMKRPSPMWSMHAHVVDVVDVVDVRRSCGRCGRFPSLMWAPVAHVGPA